MVGDEDPLTDSEWGIIPDLTDFSCNLMTQNEGSLGPSIPFHNIAAADAAGHHLDQQLPRADFWNGHLFKTDILVAVIHSHAHVFYLAV
jgi:hypothetical protein